MKKKLAFLLLLPLTFTLCSCNESDKITFHCSDFTFETYYNDRYFLMDNASYHEEIALASHAMALATFHGGDDYTTHGDYLKELWNKEHFDNLWLNPDFYAKPTIDSIGYGIASKKVNVLGGNFTLIAVAVRGGNYDAEWASNFTIGGSGNATGFDEASSTVVEGINGYLERYNISGNIKIWISGFSRAAITSNMTAGKIADGGIDVSTVNYTYKDIYAYCFEPPMGVDSNGVDVNDVKYCGIHNLVNYNDLVPLVAPYEWGFARYGTDHYYPDRLNDIFFDYSEREKIISLYHFTEGAQNFAEYTVDKWAFFDVGERQAEENNLPRTTLHPSQGRFVHTFIHELATYGFKNREIYSTILQQGVVDLFAAIYGYNDEIDELGSINIVELIFEYDFIKNLFFELQNGQASEFATDAQMLFLQIFGANEINLNAIRDLYKENFSFFYYLPNAFAIRKDIAAQLFYRDNMMGLLIGHMPELSYSLLKACDSRFMGEKKCKLNDGDYQVLHVENPTTITLFEKQIKKNVFTYKEGKMESDYLSAEQLNDGSINIYLPMNGEYEYIIDADHAYVSAIDPIAGENEDSTDIPAKGTL